MVFSSLFIWCTTYCVQTGSKDDDLLEEYWLLGEVPMLDRVCDYLVRVFGMLDNFEVTFFAGIVTLSNGRKHFV